MKNIVIKIFESTVVTRFPFVRMRHDLEMHVSSPRGPKTIHTGYPLSQSVTRLFQKTVTSGGAQSGAAMNAAAELDRTMDQKLLAADETNDTRVPYEPKGYMYNKLKYYRRLEQDWVRLSPSPNLLPSRLDLAPPPHVLPAEGMWIES